MNIKRKISFLLATMLLSGCAGILSGCGSSKGSGDGEQNKSTIILPADTTGVTGSETPAKTELHEKVKATASNTAESEIEIPAMDIAETEFAAASTSEKPENTSEPASVQTIAQTPATTVKPTEKPAVQTASATSGSTSSVSASTSADSSKETPAVTPASQPTEIPLQTSQPETCSADQPVEVEEIEYSVEDNGDSTGGIGSVDEITLPEIPMD